MNKKVLLAATWRLYGTSANGRVAVGAGPSGRLITGMQRSTARSSGRPNFPYIRWTAMPSASLLSFLLPWQERLGVAFGWF
jgi:hypothetical protein